LREAEMKCGTATSAIFGVRGELKKQTQLKKWKIKIITKLKYQQYPCCPNWRLFKPMPPKHTLQEIKRKIQKKKKGKIREQLRESCQLFS
jgi:hypothetical protein